MARIPNNGPVDVRALAKLLGYPITYDVKKLCIHPNINKWSLAKPIRFQKDFNVGAYEQSLSGYGISIPTFNNKADALNCLFDGYDKWGYEKPTGGLESPFRLGDFKGYNHNAPRFYNVTSDSSITESPYAIDYAVTLNLINPYSEEDDDDLGCVMIHNTDLHDNYFAVAIYKSRTSPTYAPLYIHPEPVNYLSPDVIELTVQLWELDKDVEYTVYPLFVDAPDEADVTKYMVLEGDLNKFVMTSPVRLTLTATRDVDFYEVDWEIKLENLTDKGVELLNCSMELRYADSHWTNPIIPYEEYEEYFGRINIPANGTVIKKASSIENTYFPDYEQHGGALIRFINTSYNSLNFSKSVQDI